MDDFTEKQLEQINEELLQKVARTKIDYENAKAVTRELKMIRQDLGAVNPDGTKASLNALRMERASTSAYADAIKAPTDFTLSQKLPLSTPEIHSPNTGHFTCGCGSRLAFGTEPGAKTCLINQTHNQDGKIGECPN